MWSKNRLNSPTSGVFSSRSPRILRFPRGGDCLQSSRSLLSSQLCRLSWSQGIGWGLTTYYVPDQDASDMLNKMRPEFYDPERPPAASKVMVHGVARSDRTLTMDMIAVGREP